MYFLTVNGSEAVTAAFMPGRNTRTGTLPKTVVVENEMTGGWLCLGAESPDLGNMRADSS